MRNHRRFFGLACIRFILASLSIFSLFFSRLIPSMTRWAVAVLPPTACDIFFAMTSLGILLCCIIRTCCFVAWSNFRTFSSIWADSRCCFVAAVANAKKQRKRHPTTLMTDNMRDSGGGGTQWYVVEILKQEKKERREKTEKSVVARPNHSIKSYRQKAYNCTSK